MKILLIEDERKMAQSVRQWLEEYDHVVDCAFDGNAGAAAALKNTYDVIVSDVIMPEQNGIELCRKLRQAGINTPVLMISALSQTDDKITGLDAGADDYLAKPFEMKELHARINALARRRNIPVVNSNKLLFANVELDLDLYEAYRAGKKILLTPREFELMVYFIKNQGRIIPKTEILKSVWELDIEINTNVVEVYVNYLRNKIDKGFDQKIIHTHFGVGYVLKTEI
jgi:two-component system copper resistance phosphate regulon response regulator CusR